MSFYKGLLVGILLVLLFIYLAPGGEHLKSISNSDRLFGVPLLK